MKLSSLKRPDGSTRKRHRVGRGRGSGRGKTSGRGSKGFKARAGSRVKAGYEGGQMPLQRRLPKRGFRPVRKVVYQVVNIGALARDTQSIEYSPEVMKELGLIKYSDRPVKVLGSGTIDREIHVRAHSFSEAARRKITDVGGGVEVI